MMLTGILKINKKGNLVLIRKLENKKEERIVNLPTAREILKSLAEVYRIEVDSEKGTIIIRLKNWSALYFAEKNKDNEFRCTN